MSNLAWEGGKKEIWNEASKEICFIEGVRQDYADSQTARKITQDSFKSEAGILTKSGMRN